MNTYFIVLTYFIIYSFLGWILESLYRSFCEKKLINTGFLYGPFCPIYGIGALIMLLFLNIFKDNILLLFISTSVMLTIWEYFVGLCLEKIFETKYWDYSDHKFNIQGRICLTNSLYWGILGVIFIRYIHPNIESVILKIDVTLMYYIISIVAVIVLIDTVTTIIKVKSIKSTLEQIEKLNIEIKEKLKEIKLIKKEENTVSIANIQNIIEKLKKKRNRTIIHLYRNVYRLKRAFPAINTKEITEILNAKIEKYRKIRKK